MIAPIMLLFELPDREIYLIALVPSAWSYFVHANARIGFGKFWWLLSSPHYHRIHHSIRPEHRDKNFAVWFPFYDVTFGTAHRPRPGEFPGRVSRAWGWRAYRMPSSCPSSAKGPNGGTSVDRQPLAARRCSSEAASASRAGADAGSSAASMASSTVASQAKRTASRAASGTSS
jgi:hypothetical protein